MEEFQLAYSVDGRRLAVAQYGKLKPRVTVLDTGSRRPVARFAIPDGDYDLMRYSADGRRLDTPWPPKARMSNRFRNYSPRRGRFPVAPPQPEE